MFEEKLHDGVPFSSAEYKKALEAVSPEKWKQIVFGYCTRGLDEFAVKRGREYLFSELRLPNSGEEERILERLFQYDFQLAMQVRRHGEDVLNRPVSINLVREKENYLSRLASHIKRTGDYGVISRLLFVLDNEANRTSEAQKMFFGADLFALYLLVGGPNRFLGGTKDSANWISFDWIEGLSDHGDILNVVKPMITLLHLIGARESVVLPRVPLLKPGEVWLPSPERSIGDIMEDAFYGKQYDIPFEGAEVKLVDARDITGMVLIQSAEMVMARVITKRGDAFVSINLDDMLLFSSAEFKRDIGYTPDEQEYTTSPWVNIVAEVYHDLVTAVKVKAGEPRQLRVTKHYPLAGGGTVVDTGPKVIYIPRFVRVGQEPKIRLPLEGLPRPVTPHRVVGHKRKAHMTESHREAIQAFELKAGLKILSSLPEGYTYVRPFVVPKGTEGEMLKLPQFIRRRIQQRLEIQIQDTASL